MATYLVGDIQGCYDGLERLLAEVEFNPAKDTLIGVGDLIARGPDSLKTLKYLYKLGDSFNTVLGNHDLHFLAITQGIAYAKQNDQLTPLLNDKNLSRYIEWLRQFPLALRLDKNSLVAHAGLYPTWSFKKAVALSDEVCESLTGKHWREMLTKMYGAEPRLWNNQLSGQSRNRFIINAFTRMRFLTLGKALEFNTKSSPSNSPKTLHPWFLFKNKKLKDNQRVFFGHWASLMGNTGNEQYIGLDTGYVWGNQMTLFNLKKNELVSVDNLKKNSR